MTISGSWESLAHGASLVRAPSAATLDRRGNSAIRQLLACGLVPSWAGIGVGPDGACEVGWKGGPRDDLLGH